MDNDHGIFHMMEKDGKLSLVYRHPITQTRSPTSSGRIVSSDNPLLQPFFLCPRVRWKNKDFPFTISLSSITNVPFGSIINYVFYIYAHDDHLVLPLFWCNNKEFDVNGGCSACNGSYFGTDYYFSNYCNQMYHKECVESPLKIKHPYHPEHSLECYIHPPFGDNNECLCCGRIATDLLYYCTICETVMHTTCAVKSIPFVVDQPKSHNHSLTLFPRQASLTCNVCGLLRKNNATYVCLRCNFVAHNDCMYSPRVIKISRHHHRISYNSSLRCGKCISYTSSLQSREWSCGVCRKSIDGVYGAYTCEKCDDYVVHVRCALRNDVWDGVDLQGVPKEEGDDITKDVGPFEKIYEGVILHFLHDHHLQLEVSILYDENRRCQACVLPIFEGNFYSCMECNFILHETCAKARRRVQHALHPHPLTLKPVARYEDGEFLCSACDRISSGFVYECQVGSCTFDLDVRCASISEPFHYKGHKHPLFLALTPKDKPICQVCTSESHIPLNCIKCGFVVCMKCATLPYRARYKCDKHFLRILCGDEVCEKDWCEVCELNLGDTKTKVVYWCNECCTTLHTECLFGEDLYLKPGHYFEVDGMVVQILCKSNLSRPVCDSCKKPCQGNIFTGDDFITCSRRCMFDIVY